MGHRVSRRQFLVLAAAAASGCASRGRGEESPPAWKAGLAKVRITPDKSVWMTGFASRTKPSEGTMHDLYARALALEDASGDRAVLVTADLIGVSASVAKMVTDEAQRRYGLARDRVMLAFSHTHGGPSVTNLLRVLANPRMTPEQQRDTDDYTRGLVDKVAALVGEALADLRPARLAVGQGEAPFAMGVIQMDDGARLTTQIVDVPFDQVKIGLPVKLEFRRISSEGEAGIIHYGHKAVPLRDQSR